jgi:predicted nucleic-acid-binding protein
MIGLDTNVLIRWLVDDGSSPWEAEAAARVMQGGSLHLSAIALAETIWVLTRVYRRSADEVTAVVRALLDMPSLTIESEAPVEAALAQFDRHGGDLNDHLLAAHDAVAGCSHTVTFDRIAARSQRFKLLSKQG